MSAPSPDARAEHASGPAGESLAWSVLLPERTTWLPGSSWPSARKTRAGAAPAGPGELLAVPVTPRRAAAAAAACDPLTARAYLALPSASQPIVVASRDGAVLRYVADAILSPPPGAGSVTTIAVTVARWALRWPPMWTVAATLRAAGLVLVGRRR